MNHVADRVSSEGLPNFQQTPSDEAIMEGMLRVRFDYAQRQTKDYSHLFRQKSRLELIRLAFYQICVEFTYAAETALASPIILSNGLSHTFMTMIWAFSPTLGFVFAPMIATLSDQTRSRWGRRRPVLLALGTAVVCGLMIMPHGKTLGLWLGDEDVPVEQMSGFRWGILLTTVGLMLTDFDIETSSGVARTYFMDMCILSDHAKVLSTAMIIGGIGGSGGYLLGAIDWQQTDLGSLMGSNEATVFAVVVLVMIIGLSLTLTSFREVPLPVLEKDPLLRPITQGMFEAEKARQLAIYSISPKVPVDVVKKPDGSVPVELDDTVQEGEMTFANFFRNLRHMPRSLMILYLTQFLAQFGYLSYCMYFTDFVGSAVFGGDVAAPVGSPELALYEEGVRFGCWGMALFTISAALYSTIIGKLIKYFGGRTIFIGGLLVNSVGMLAMALFTERWMVFVCCPGVGIAYATMYAVPFLAISQYHAKNSFAMKDGQYVESSQRRGFGADVSMLSSMLFLSQLIIALSIGSVIDAFESTTVVIFTASLFSFLAAISASQVLYMEL
ncbi:proton-associated sugar transporter A-like [Culex pipiens pallens]|uniref:proton-associated sugar transporter A-like n=1 Tax=Culex pipiens pallens TaxID=42434 RepID=UPI00195459B6|nr:proton-associated sugar transporter A-like [Culex pipiens pallens]